MADKEHIVYILKCKDNSLYTGYTNDLTRRLRMHEDGKGAKYTRGRGPFQVEFVETFVTKEEAMQKEYAIKQLAKRDKEQLIRLNKEEVLQYEDSKEL